MWQVTKDGINEMTSGYFGIKLTDSGFEIVSSTLNREYPEYEETDDTITDTNIRDIIADVIVNEFVEGFNSWPINGDTDDVKQEFASEMQKTLNAGVYVVEVSEV